MFWINWIGLAFGVVVGVMAYRRQRTRYRRDLPDAIGFAVLAFLFSIPTLIWWAVADWKIGRRRPSSH